MGERPTLFPMSSHTGLGRGCFVRPSRAAQYVDALIRTNSLTRRDQGKRDLGTFSELCPSWDRPDTICLLGINTQTFAVNCNSAVWAVLLCVSAHRHRVPFLGIQPSSVPSIGSLEHIYYARYQDQKPLSSEPVCAIHMQWPLT